jgi:pyridoxamine 5'-phosphate oxidase-like protein
MATVIAPPKHEAERASPVTGEQVWQKVYAGSFAVLSYVTPDGEPRSSGVMYTTIARHLYIAIASDGWKARHIPATGRVSVTIPVRRGGVLALFTPIPPATITFHGRAIVHATDEPEVQSHLAALSKLLPPDRRTTASVVEVIPDGSFVTYGVGVSLGMMRDPDAARARVSVGNRGGEWR